jgi:hypothetical protein
MVLKFSQQMKHAQKNEKYIRLIFNSYISDGDFFKSMRIISVGNNFFQALAKMAIAKVDFTIK